MANEAGNDRARRRFIPIIDARFQWKYTLIVVALGAGVSAVMSAFLYKAHRDNTELTKLGLSPELYQQVIQGDQIFLLYLIVGTLLIALVLGLWGLVITHRISGPIYIVARHLSTLASGRFPDLRPLRKHDELQDFFTVFEEAVDSLKKKDQDLLEAAEQGLSGGDAKSALQKIRDRLSAAGAE